MQYMYICVYMCVYVCNIHINALSIPSCLLIWSIPWVSAIILPYFSNISPSLSIFSIKVTLISVFFSVFNLLRAIFTWNHPARYSPPKSGIRTSIVRPHHEKQSTCDDRIVAPRKAASKTSSSSVAFCTWIIKPPLSNFTSIFHFKNLVNQFYFCMYWFNWPAMKVSSFNF